MTNKKSKPSSKTKQNFLTKNSTILSFFILLNVIIYFNGLLNEYAFDDIWYVKNNQQITSISKIPSSFTKDFGEGSAKNIGLYRPMTTTFYTLIFAIGELNPFFYHLFNILIHSIISYLIYYLAILFFKNIWTAFLAGIIFSIAPIHTEAVYNIAVLSELLACLFSTLAFVIYYCIRNNVIIKDGIFTSHVIKKKRKYEIILLILFFCGLFSKESAIMIFFVILAYEIIYFTKTMKKSMFIFIGMIVVIGIYLLMRIMALGSLVPSYTVDFLDNPIVDPSLLFWEKYGTVVLTYGYYLLLMVFPVNLSADYTYQAIMPVTSFFDYRVLLPIVVLIMSVFLFIYFYKRNKLLSFLIIYFYLTYSIISNFIIKIGTILGERLMYNPSVAFYLLFAVTIGFIINKFIKDNRKNAIVHIVIIIIVIGFYGTISFLRGIDWKDTPTLFEADLKVSDQSTKVYQNIASFRQDQATSDPLFIKAIQDVRNNNSVGTAINRIRDDINNLLKDITSRLRTYDELTAEKDYFQHVITLNDTELKAYLGVDSNINVLLANKNIFLLKLASLYARDSLMIYNDNPSSRLTHAASLFNQQKLNEAIEQFKILTLRPEQDRGVLLGHYYLGECYISLNRLDLAENEFFQLTQIASGNNVFVDRGYRKLGKIAIIKQDYKKAEEYTLSAINVNKQRNSDDHEAQVQLGEIYIKMNQWEQAKSALEKAISIAIYENNDRANAYYLLSLYYVNKGNSNIANKMIQECLKFNPQHAQAKAFLQGR